MNIGEARCRGYMKIMHPTPLPLRRSFALYGGACGGELVGRDAVSPFALSLVERAVRSLQQDLRRGREAENMRDLGGRSDTDRNNRNSRGAALKIDRQVLHSGAHFARSFQRAVAVGACKNHG